MDEISAPNRVMSGLSVESLGLVDAATPATFDSLTRLALRLFRVPVALISIVQEEKDRQYFLSQQDLAEPWASRRHTPLTHSFCQHVKREGVPLVVNDARRHPLVHNSRAIEDLDVVAYLGVPILMPDGNPVGALCVVEPNVREWDDEDLATLADLANCVNDEILLRAALSTAERMHERSLRHNAMREAIALAFMAPDLSIDARFEQLLRASCDALNVTSGRVIKVDCGLIETLFSNDPTSHFATLASQANLEVLTRSVISECSAVSFHDLFRDSPTMQFGRPPTVGGCYIGCPLIFNGALYGVLEFCSASPKEEPFSIEDSSILKVAATLSTAHLGVHSQISTLRNSEAGLYQTIAGNGRHF